jgi:hypothetical protein
METPRPNANHVIMGMMETRLDVLFSMGLQTLMANHSYFSSSLRFVCAMNE